MKNEVIVKEESNLSTQVDNGSITKEQVVIIFKEYKYKPKMYMSVLKRYLDYLIDIQLPINKSSVLMFLSYLENEKEIKNLSPYKTPLNKLIKVVAPEKGFLEKKVIKSTIPKTIMETKLDWIFEKFLNDDTNGIKGERTKIEYRKSFKTFLAFIIKKFGQIEPESVGVFDYEMVSSYRNEIINKPRPDNKKLRTNFGVNHLLAPIRGLASYLLDNIEDYTHNWTMEEIRHFERDLRRISRMKNRKVSNSEWYKDSLDHHEVLRVLEHCKNPKEKLIVALMYFTGLRTAEVLELRREDFNFKGKTLTVLGKGLKKASIDISYCHSTLESFYKEYIRFAKTKEDEKLFDINSTASLRHFVNDILKRLDLKQKKKKVSCHSFRHSLAQNLLLLGHPVEKVQEILRHESIETTMKYFRKIQKERMIKIPENVLTMDKEILQQS